MTGEHRTPGLLAAAVLITRKDLLQRLRDRSAYLMGIVAPFGLAFILSLTFGDTGDDFGFEFAVFDGDGGPVAAEVTSHLEALDGDDSFDIMTIASLAEAQQLADDNEVSASIVIDPGFSAAVSSGQGGSLRVISNPQADIGTDVAAAIASTLASELDSVARSVAAASLLAGSPPNSEQAAVWADRAAAVPLPTSLTIEAAEGEGLDFTTYYAVGMSVFFLFFTVQFGILGLVSERTDGTLARLLASPIRPVSVILGKLGTGLVLGLVSMTVLIVGTTLLLGANWGAFLPVAMLVVAGVLSAMAIVALVATLARSPQQAESYSAIVAVVLAVLGGAFFPVSFGGGLLNLVSYLTPHRWLLDGFRDLSFGEGVSAIAPNVLALLLFTVLIGGIGLSRARRLVEA
ncbi:MAG: ABC transporter permease [Actinomycetia bacterium]|nr:ABC transporter permease [Actinomycetes bacterium]MCP3912765.1 ABC transporter permease [Actinomycetes bacterium]